MGVKYYHAVPEFEDNDLDVNFTRAETAYNLLRIANELASLVKLKKIELKHSIRFNLTKQEKKEIDEA